MCARRPPRRIDASFYRITSYNVCYTKLLRAPKDRKRGADDEEQPDAQHRNHHHEDQREFPAHQKGHDDRENEHQRAAHRDADEHHKRVLHVGYIRGQARDQRRGREAVDVFKRKGLDIVEQSYNFV